MNVRLFIKDGCYWYNLPKSAQRKLEKELTFANPEYEAAIKQGMYISSDVMPEIYFYGKEKNNYFTPKGYIYFLRRFLKQEGYIVKVKDKSVRGNKLNLKFHGKLRDYQQTLVNDLLKYPVGMMEALTGCLTGDTVVRLNRASKGFSTTIQKLYERHNSIVTTGIRKLGNSTAKFYHKQWNLSIPTYIRSYNHHENQILLNKVNAVVYSGIKKVYRFGFENGKSIKATLNHKILTAKGWKKLKDVNQYDLVMVDSPYTVKSKTKKQKAPYKRIYGLKYHPYSYKLIPSKSKTSLFRRPLHIVAYEAFLNDMDIDTYIDILKNDKNKSKVLDFIDSLKYSIHHIDHDTTNNNISNLRMMKIGEHEKLHSVHTKKNFGQGIPSYVRIISKKYIGKVPTYDICCANPYNNFTANDIVVHNSGKTVTACGVIAKIDRPTLILVHSKELLYQWQEAIKKFLHYDCGLLGDGKTDINDITVAIINTAEKHAAKLAVRFGMLICDEGHRAAGKRFRDMIIKMESKYHYLLSATPFRRDGLTHALYALFGPKTKTDVKHLREKGYVLVPDIHRVYSDWRHLFINYAAMLTEMCLSDVRNNLIARVADDDYKRFKQSILIVSDRKNHLSEIQKHLKVKSKILTGGTPDKERTKITNDVKAGKIKVLLSTCQLISEGFDSPDLSALILSTPIRDKKKVIQVAGRVLRPSKGQNPRIFDIRDQEVNVLRYSGFARDRIYRDEWGQ